MPRLRADAPSKPTSVRYTNAEKSEVRAAAIMRGMELSAWIRFVTLEVARDTAPRKKKKKS